MIITRQTFFLAAIEYLAPFINAFFEKCYVMDDDKEIRENRLAILQKIAALQDGIVDLSKLEGF